MVPGSLHVPAAHAVVEALVAVGVDHAFCVPGESFLGLLDALYDEKRVRVIATRHEGGASFMAEAYAKLTHKPTVCMGTRMVGGGNLAIGLHTARQDSSPVIALLGQVATRERYKEAFQESELAHVFAPAVKWAVEPPRADRIGDLVLLAVGTRLNEYTSQGFQVPDRTTRFVHVDISAEGLGAHRLADVACQADA